MEENKVSPHPIVFVDAKGSQSSGVDLDRIVSKKNAVFEALEQEKHSYAARFAEWIAANYWRPTVGSKNWAKWDPDSGFWIYETTSQLLTLFNEYESKKGGGE